MAEPKPRPTHYRIVCISLYHRDLERLERLVSELKARGHTKANRSAVIRYALDALGPEQLDRLALLARGS